MEIKEAIFIQSNTDYKNCPNPDKAEYAFIGRSNVGKSSLINMLTGHPNLAKTSQKPGKTQLINHFLINSSWYLVDLPGYGWAQASKNDREKWDKMTKQYLLNRENLFCVFVLIDSRHEAQQVDLSFMQWLNKSDVPFAVVFTKIDKQSKTKTDLLINQYINKMLEYWEEMPPYFITSATTRDGRDEVLSYIENLNHQYKEAQ